LSDVKALVIDSVEKGRDLMGLETGLKSRYDITLRRATMIAKDQNNKATQGIAMLKMKDAGIKRAIWRHNSASKHFREEHVEMDGTEFDLEEGCYDPVEGRNIQPGELVNCHCSFRPIIPEPGGE
jgi:uncharacterized protein with gpF-like domain